MSVDVTSTDVELVINVTAKAGDIVGYTDFDVLEGLGATRILDFTSTSIFATDGVSRLDLSVETALKTFLVQAVVRAKQEDGSVDDSTCANPAVCTGFLAAVGDLAILYTKPATLLSTLCPAGLCQANVMPVLDGANKSGIALALPAASMANRSSTIANALNTLDLSTGDDKIFFDSVLAALTDAQNSTDEVTDSGPKVTALQGEVTIGQTLKQEVCMQAAAIGVFGLMHASGLFVDCLHAVQCPCVLAVTIVPSRRHVSACFNSCYLQTLLLLLNLDNRASVTQVISDALLSLPFVVSVSNVRVLDASRRRSSSGLTVQVGCASRSVHSLVLPRDLAYPPISPALPTL